MNKQRILKLEKKLIDKDHGLRVVVDVCVYYGEFNPETDIYWTDEDYTMTLDDYYSGKKYRRVKHPDGLIPKAGMLEGVA